ncbi:MAG: hypothetical protein N3E38_03010 [Candidatus Aenigmarchaeota archaeon]|nr:hypothetical protein [Candidatus Aenigmarchaeota archaeon]
MLKFDPLRQITGLSLILLAWLDPFSWGEEFRIVAFIIGFDMMTLLPKIIIFGIDYFWDISGYGLFLLIQVAQEIIFDIFTIGRIIELITKPLIVFFIIYFNGFGFWLSSIAAVIDFIFNLNKKVL